MPTDPPETEGTRTPKPDDDDCADLIGEAYKAGFANGQTYGLKLGEKYCCIWWKRVFCLYYGLPLDLKKKENGSDGS